MKVMSTAGLLRLTSGVRLADGRMLSEALDPDGVHGVGMSMVHNDDEVRAQMLCKLRDSDEPFLLMVNIPLAVFNNLSEVR